MKTSDFFLKAKTDKELTAMLIVDRFEFTDNTLTDQIRKKYIRLCLDVKNKYNNESEMIFVECDTDIYYEDYSGKYTIKNSENNNTLKTCFHCSIYKYHANHINTFLKAIKKESDVKFKVICFNNSQFYNDNDLVCHQLFGIIDDKFYFLDSYVGRSNLASPVQY
jgi:hypothetical protein